MKLGITRRRWGHSGGNRVDLWGFHGSRLDPAVAESHHASVAANESETRHREVGGGASFRRQIEGPSTVRERRHRHDRAASSETGGSTETPLVQRLERPPGSHEGLGVRTAEGTHHGDLSGRQVPTVEWEAGSGALPR